MTRLHLREHPHVGRHPLREILLASPDRADVILVPDSFWKRCIMKSKHYSSVRIVVSVGLSLLALSILTACSARQIAIDNLGDALAESGTTFASDDDPDLVGDAIPFSLKLIESLLAESPRHEGLLLAASRGFTQYSYGWVHQRGDELADEDYFASEYELQRAKRLYLRASRYGMRLLDVRHPGLTSNIRLAPRDALQQTDEADVPALYWTATSLGLAISLSKDDPLVIADLPLVEAMIDRALALDESFDDGAIHSFLITFEQHRAGARPADAERRAREHFERAVALSNGALASPFLALAESVSLPGQDRTEFERLIDQALSIDADAHPEWRLQNLLTQRRARWLLSNVDDLFYDDENEGDAQ